MRMILAVTPRHFQIFLLICTVASWPVQGYTDFRHYFQIVYDSSEPTVRDFKADFGYAVYVHVDDKKILLDTGTDPDVMQHNLVTAGVDVNELDMVIISHNHHDHAGGLERIRAMNTSLPVYAPPNQVLPVDDVRVVEDYLKITSNVFVIRGHTDKPTGGISDDLSVVLRSRKGLYVLSTCSHSGVGQILERASKVVGDDIYYFSGGSRLVFRPERETQVVAETLDQLKVQVVSPSHCSLSHRVDKDLREVLGERVRKSQLGKKIEVDLGKSH